MGLNHGATVKPFSAKRRLAHLAVRDQIDATHEVVKEKRLVELEDLAQLLGSKCLCAPVIDSGVRRLRVAQRLEIMLCACRSGTWRRAGCGDGDKVTCRAAVIEVAISSCTV